MEHDGADARDRIEVGTVMDDRPTQEEIDELRRLLAKIEANELPDAPLALVSVAFFTAVRKTLPRLLDMINQEGGDPHTQPGRPATAADNEKPVSALSGPGRATSPVPGMETTVEELVDWALAARACIGINSVVLSIDEKAELKSEWLRLGPSPSSMLVFIADHDRVLAEVARLNAALAVSTTRDKIIETLRQMIADGTAREAAAREEERERCAKIAEAYPIFVRTTDGQAERRSNCFDIAAAIRSQP